MTVLLNGRSDISLDALRRVAWEGEGVELGQEAIAQMDRAHEAFDGYVKASLAEDPEALIYGVTTGPGDDGRRTLSEEAADASLDRRVIRRTAAGAGRPRHRPGPAGELRGGPRDRPRRGGARDRGDAGRRKTAPGSRAG